MLTYSQLTSSIQRKLRKSGHPELAKRVSRAISGGKTTDEQIDRISVTLERIKKENRKSYRVIEHESKDFFRYYNNLWI